jgi:pSer/pThr/pTyr-binding forkhead associated (FHA) protein
MSLVIDDELVIGRLAEGAGRLGDDEEISRSHARLSMDPSGQCTIEDLGSTNGTWVNGMRIATPQTLAEGDTVEVGGTTMVVREVPSVAEQAPPEPPAAPPQRTVTQATPDAFAPEALAAQAPPAEAEGVAPGAEAELPEEPLVESPAPEPVAPESPVGVPTEPLAETEAPVSAPVAGAPQTLSLQLDIDFAARELQIRLDDSAEPVRLVFDGDSWRSASSPSTEKGNPA